MKKFLPLLAFVLLAAIAGLYGLEYYRELRERQREQVAHLLSRCINQGLLSLFALQTNDWRARPDFYREQQEKLSAAAAELPEKLLEARPFGEWQAAVEICEKLTRHSNLQHETIFRPLGRFAAREMSDIGTAKSSPKLAWRSRRIYRLKVAAQAADRYLQDLRTDVESLLSNSSLSAETRARVQTQIDAEVLDHYRRGDFSLRRVNTYLERVERYYQLLADNPRGFALRNGSLFFYDKDLRLQIDNLNSAILQGEADFYGNWRQLVQR